MNNFFPCFTWGYYVLCVCLFNKEINKLSMKLNEREGEREKFLEYILAKLNPVLSTVS